MTTGSSPTSGLIGFPPPRPFLLLPIRSRSSFRASLALWAACRPGARAFLAATDWAVRIFGTRPLRLLGTGEWTPPVSRLAWEAIDDVVGNWFPAFDAIAVYLPRQAEREGFALLLLGEGQTVGFLKARPGIEFLTEMRVLEALKEARGFRVPDVRGRAEIDGWSVLGLSAVASGRTSPRLSGSPLAITEEISDLLLAVAPERTGRPAHWQPMHGDLGPWNLRQTKEGQIVAFDWEHVEWAPPRADLAFHAAACSAMRIGRETALEDVEESVAFWQREIPKRFSGGATDQRLARQMLYWLDGR